MEGLHDLELIKEHVDRINDDNDRVEDGYKVVDRVWDQMVVFRSLSGHCVWFDQDLGVAEIGPAIRKGCWCSGAFSTTKSSMIRVVKCSALGIKVAPKMVGVYRGSLTGKEERVIDTRWSTLGGVLVLPDGVFDAMAPLLRRGMVIWPQAIDPRNVSEEGIGGFNGVGVKRCRGVIGLFESNYRLSVTGFKNQGNEVAPYKVSIPHGAEWLDFTNKGVFQPWEAYAMMMGRPTDELSRSGGMKVAVDDRALAERILKVFPEDKVKRLDNESLLGWVINRMVSRLGVLVMHSDPVSNRRSYQTYVLPHRTNLGVWTWLREVRKGKMEEWPIEDLIMSDVSLAGTGLKAIWRKVVERRLEGRMPVGPGLVKCKQGGVLAKHRMSLYDTFKIAYRPYGIGVNGATLEKGGQPEYLNGGPLRSDMDCSKEVLDKLVITRKELLGECTDSKKAKRIETDKRIREAASVV